MWRKCIILASRDKAQNGTVKHVTSHSRTPILFQSQFNPVHTFTPYFYKKHFNIYVVSKPWRKKWQLPWKISDQNFAWILHYIYIQWCYISPSNNTMWKVQIICLPTVTVFFLISLRFSSALCSEALIVCSVFRMAVVTRYIYVPPAVTWRKSLCFPHSASCCTSQLHFQAKDTISERILRFPALYARELYCFWSCKFHVSNTILFFASSRHSNGLLELQLSWTLWKVWKRHLKMNNNILIALRIKNTDQLKKCNAQKYYLLFPFCVLDSMK